MIEAKKRYNEGRKHTALAERLLDQLREEAGVVSRETLTKIVNCKATLLSDQRNNQILFKEKNIAGVSFSNLKKITRVFLEITSLGSMYALSIFDQIRKKNGEDRDSDLEKTYLSFMYITFCIFFGMEIDGHVKFLSRKYKLEIYKNNFRRNVLISDLSYLIEKVNQRSSYNLQNSGDNFLLRRITSFHRKPIFFEEVIVFPDSQQSSPNTTDTILTGVHSLKAVEKKLIPFCQVEKEIEPLFSKWHDLLEEMFSTVNSMGRILAGVQEVPLLDQWQNHLEKIIQKLEIQYNRAQYISCSFMHSSTGLCSYKKVLRLKNGTLFTYPLQIVGLVQFTRYVKQKEKADGNLFLMGLLIFTIGWLLGKFHFYLGKKIYRYMILSHQIEMVLSEFGYIELAKNLCEILKEWKDFLATESPDRVQGEKLVDRIKQQITYPFDRAICISDLTRRVESKITVDIEA